MTTKTSQKYLFSTRLDIPEASRIKLIELLNKTLASTLDLQTQIKQAHWNVKGWDFYQLHLMFDEIAEEVEGYVDTIAERITTLGGYAMGTARTAARDSSIPEYPFEAVSGSDHLHALADRLAAYARMVRAAIEQANDLGDLDTADLFTEVSRGIDKRLWFVEAHLQGN